jgi:hypothetical protein
VLFRLLTSRPRPVWPLDYRIRAAPDVALFVCGLTGREDASAWADNYDEPEALRRGITMGKLVAVALCDSGATRMLDYGHTGQLDPVELATLAIHVTKALNIVSPTMWRCDISAWRERLRAGAQHFTNVADMMAMAESGEPTAEMGIRQWSPDRYYGIPICELTDGQILAYDAAQLAYRDRVPKKEKKWPTLPTPSLR